GLIAAYSDINVVGGVRILRNCRVVWRIHRARGSSGKEQPPFKRLKAYTPVNREDRFSQHGGSTRPKACV
ncbi:MAG: hypothetical protein WA376_09710, partial [Terrimicrobiaceae bacterium]